MYRIVLLIVVAGAWLAGCGSGAPAGSSAPSPAAVTVNLTEFKIEPSLTNFKVGVPYRFVVSNKGTINHDFSISPPVMGHDGMGMSTEQAHENALAAIPAEDLPPGASKTINLTFSEPFSANELEIACHTPGHYESGMHVPITVTQ